MTNRVASIRCAFCGVESRAHNDWQKYCSAACRQKAYWQRRVEAAVRAALAARSGK